MNTNTGRSGGISILGLLGVAFVVLKLTGHIDWSWVWVLAPFWGPFALLAMIGAGVLLVMVIIIIFERIGR